MALFLQKLGCRCEITALKFVNDGKYLLSGEGSFLNVYNSEKGNCVYRYSCLESNKIHGIETFNIVNDVELIVCFGHRELNLIGFNGKRGKIESIMEHGMLLTDWILDCKVLTMENIKDKDNDKDNENGIKLELAVGLMHNQVIIYSFDIKIDLNGESIKLSNFDRVVTIENENSSLLYCMSFYGNDKDSLVVAAGDCFNHLLIWQVFDESGKNSKSENYDNGEKKAKVKFRGRRKGVLYSIKWSKNGKYLCCASDDRSVQLWQFVNSQQLTVVYSVFGHTARVLDCWISSNGEYIVSISEDSTCRVWNQIGDAIECFELGKTGQIWSLDALCMKNENKKQDFDKYYVALGGCDASIRLHYFLAPKGRKNNYPLSITPTAMSTHSSDDNNSEEKTSNNVNDGYRVDFQRQSNIAKREMKDASKSDLFGSMKHFNDCHIFKYLEFPSFITALLANESLSSNHKSSNSIDDSLIDFDDRRGKKKKRNRNRGRSSKISASRTITTVRNMIINSKQEIYFATANDVFCVCDLNNNGNDIKWDQICHFSNESGKDITTMILASDQENHRNENIFERWLIVGDRGGTVTIIDIKNGNKKIFSYRAHDIGIISMYAFVNVNLILLTSDGHGNISYWTFDINELLSGNVKGKKDDSKNEMNETETEMIAVMPSATFLNPNRKQISAYCFVESEKLLICGDARGNIMVFDMNDDIVKNGKAMHQKPIQVLKNVHGREPISCLKIVTNDQSMSISIDKGCKDNEKKMDRVISGGKDGKLVEFELLDRNLNNNELKNDDMMDINIGVNGISGINGINGMNGDSDEEDIIVLKMIGEMSSLSGTKMSSIDSVTFVDKNKLIVCGFHSNYFIVWNMIEDYILFRWNCGGLKRPHFFSFYHNINCCNGWIFGYTNSNFENGIALVNLQLSNQDKHEMYLGSLATPYHGSEIHNLQWFLHPSIAHSMKQSRERREKIASNFDESGINEMKSSNDGNDGNESKNDSSNNIMFGDILDGLLLSSCGEDGTIQTISPQFEKEWHKPAMCKPLPFDLLRRNSDGLDKLTSIGSLASVMTSTSMSDEMNGNQSFVPSVHLENERKLVLSQTGNKRFPFKCCDLVRKWDNSGYLLFAAGAKEFLQAFELCDANRNDSNQLNESKESKESNERICKWRALCWTGGDSMKHSGKTWKKSDKMMQERLSKMDLRIKSLVVIPHPKYYDKWLVVTGNSVGTIRAYTIDELEPREFQFEGEDSLLHRAMSNNSGKNNNDNGIQTRPILSLTSTFCCEKNYDWHFEASLKNIEKSKKWDKKDVSKRIIPSYTDRAPHLIFSGSTDGWIRIWFWDVDIHSIVVIDKLALHQSGVNSISVTWMDEQFVPKSKSSQNENENENENENDKDGSKNKSSKSSNNTGLVRRRLAMVSVGDDQAMCLIIADFESLMSANMAAKQRRIYQHGKHSSFALMSPNASSANLDGKDDNMIVGGSGGGWQLSIVQEMMESTCHSASVRDVCIIAMNHVTSKMDTIDTYLENNNKINYSRLNDLLIVTSGDDQRVRLWGYRFNKFENIALLDQITSDVGLISSLSCILIRNYGLIIAVAGQGLQMLCLPLSLSTKDGWTQKWNDNDKNNAINNENSDKRSSFRRFSHSSINMSQVDSESESAFSADMTN